MCLRQIHFEQIHTLYNLAKYTFHGYFLPKGSGCSPLERGDNDHWAGGLISSKEKQKYAQIFNLSLNILFVFSMKSLCEIWSFKMHNLSNAFAHSRNTNKYYFSHKEILITFQGPKINKICTLVPKVFKKRKAESLNCSIAIWCKELNISPQRRIAQKGKCKKEWRRGGRKLGEITNTENEACRIDTKQFQ